MKTYINAELQIVRMNNRDIVTDSLNVTPGTNTSNQYAPGIRDFDEF